MFPKSDPAAILADPRHAAVVRRDRTEDGLFVFAVRSSGVFCKPSCAARLPRPENIRFFDTTNEAETAGYRACLRCRPLALDGRDPGTDLMRAMADYIAAHVDETLSLDHLAAQAQLSPAPSISSERSRP